MNISGIKNDYSFLFNSYSNSSKGSSDLLSNVNLTDYKNIKSGSYGKLLKSYYSMEKVDSSAKVNSSATVEESAKSKSDETKSVNFLDTIVPKKAAVTAQVESKAQEDQPVADTSKLLYSVSGTYQDASSVLAGNFFNTAI